MDAVRPTTRIRRRAIRYRIFINGTAGSAAATPIGVGRCDHLRPVDGANTFVLRAIDSAGNVVTRSEQPVHA